MVCDNYKTEGGSQCDSHTSKPPARNNDGEDGENSAAPTLDGDDDENPKLQAYLKTFPGYQRKKGRKEKDGHNVTTIVNVGGYQGQHNQPPPHGYGFHPVPLPGGTGYGSGYQSQYGNGLFLPTNPSAACLGQTQPLVYGHTFTQRYVTPP